MSDVAFETAVAQIRAIPGISTADADALVAVLIALRAQRQSNYAAPAYRCKCGREQLAHAADSQNGLTWAEAAAIGWKRGADGWPVCPLCSDPAPASVMQIYP